MTRFTLSLVALLVAAPALGATETGTEPEDAEVPEVAPTVVSEVPPVEEVELELEEVGVAERSASDDATAAQLGPRGGFWWTVGVIVVAAVILAFLL